MSDLPWQFGPGSCPELDSQYITIAESTFSDNQDIAAKDSKISTEIEPEWQGIMAKNKACKSNWPSSMKSKRDAAKDDSGEASHKVAKKEGKSSQTEGVVWQTADSKELAALISQRSRGYLENCDLPPSKSSHAWNRVASCKFTPAEATKSGDSSLAKKLFLESLLRQNQATNSENRFVNQTVRRNGKHVNREEVLGEALCNAQTRARHAENLATQVLQERDKLARLMFRESWTARNHRQCVQTLELENNRLKRYSGDGMEL